jgi:anti-sigma B factor antagonist
MTTEDSGGVRILHPEMTQIDALNSEEFKRALSDGAAGANKIIINLSQIQFIDSSGLGILLGLVREMHERGGAICLCCARPPVQALFRMVRMSNIVTIHPTSEDALASFTA